MKPSDLVGWKSRYVMDLPTDLGVVLEKIPYELRGKDPFPHWKVFFPFRGILHCRESDLKVLG